MAYDNVSEQFRLRRRVKDLEDKHRIMAAVWDAQSEGLLERIIRLEEQCQTNTEMKPN